MKGVLWVFVILGLFTNVSCSRKVMDPATGKMVSAAKLHRAEKKRWKEQRKMQRLEERKIKKHHERIQTSNTRRAMKRHRKEADQFNSGKRTWFFSKWFRK
jgi:hypothetical protein